MFNKDQKENKKICEGENIPISFTGIKIKVCYIFRDKILI